MGGKREQRGIMLILSAGLGVLLLATAGNAYANQIDALLLPEENISSAEFAGVRFIELRYAPASPLAELLNGRNERIEFTVSGTANGTGDVDRLIQRVNNAILAGGSGTIMENATLHYFATIKGYPENAQLSYRVELNPTLAKYVIQSGNGTTPAIVDMDWREVKVNEPLVVSNDQYGEINANYPVGVLYAKLPELAEKLNSEAAKEIMQDPILNFDRFGLPMKSWHFLFDATGKQLENYDIFREGEGGTVSIYSIGEGSFREGLYLPVEKDAVISIDGTEVKIHASTPPPSGQIAIAGYSSIQEKEDIELAYVYRDNPSGPPPLGFQVQVLLVLGGIMAAVAIIVLLKARK